MYCPGGAQYLPHWTNLCRDQGACARETVAAYDCWLCSFACRYVIKTHSVYTCNVGKFINELQGIFWFSWTSSPEVEALAQVFSGVLIGSGAILTFMSGVLYLSEVYLIHANSALAINNFVRSVTAAAFPYLAGLLFADLGVDVGCSVLGAICLGLMPAPIILWKFGHIIRGWSKFAFQ